MSSEWITRIYYDLHPRAFPEFAKQIIAAVEKAGLEFYCSPDTGNGQWFGTEGWPYQEVPDLDSALELMTPDQGGTISVWFPETHLIGHLALHPLGSVGKDDDNADCNFGSVTLYFTDHDIFENEENRLLLVDRMLGIFKVSMSLAQATRALYGFGDMFIRQVHTDSYVLTTDLLQHSIPRLSWWNYFSWKFVKQSEYARLSTSIAWFTQEDKQGLTVILHPPTLPCYATPIEVEALRL